jgi:hypothetical protein
LRQRARVIEGAFEEARERQGTQKARAVPRFVGTLERGLGAIEVGDSRLESADFGRLGRALFSVEQARALLARFAQ